MLGGGGTADWLASANECDADPAVTDLETIVDDDTSVQLWDYVGCRDQASVDFYRIVGGGHTWPGSPMNLGPSFGRKTHQLDASAVMVDFMLQHVRAAEPS